QRVQAGGRVQADGVADPGVLAGVVGQQDGDALVGVGGAAQAHPVAGQVGDAGDGVGAGRGGGHRRVKGGGVGGGGLGGARAGSWASVFLNETAVVMIRPSNSGRATFMATSRGERPATLAAQTFSLLEQKMAWRTGTSTGLRTED